MDLFKTDEQIQLCGLAAIKRLSKIRPNTEILIQQGVTEVIRNAMKNFETKVNIQLVAIFAINALLKTEESKKIAFEDGLVHYIINALTNFPNKEKLVFNGLISLTTIGFEYSLMRLQVHDLILQIMKRHKANHRIVEAVCATIKMLATLEVNADMVLSRGLLTVFLDCLDKHFENEQVQEIGCVTLWSLAVWKDMKVRLTEQGVGQYVTFLCIRYRGKPKILDNALSVLTNLGTEEEVIKQLHSSSVLNVVYTAAKANLRYPEIQMKFTTILNSFCTYDLVDSSVLSSMQSYMRQIKFLHKDDDTLVEEAAKVLHLLDTHEFKYCNKY